jgi:hypothetical protein
LSSDNHGQFFENVLWVVIANDTIPARREDGEKEAAATFVEAAGFPVPVEDLRCFKGRTTKANRIHAY